MSWGIGIMECWNNGFGGMKSVLIEMAPLEIKLGNHIIFIPNIPFFRYSINPWIT
jgi:hypothetical protein